MTGHAMADICTRIVVGFIAVALLSTAGCGAERTPAIRFGLKSSPITLDPRFATDAASSRINRLIYAQLVDFDDQFRPVPALASWEHVTPTRYRFRLREERRRFHDGTRLVAGDVKATYDAVLDPAAGSPHRGSLKHIEHIRVLDDDTIEFDLTKPDPLFPGLLVIGILPARLIEKGHAFNRDPIGSGPFRFGGWPSEGKLELERLADRQRIEFLRVPDPTVRVLKLIRGEIDLLQNDLLPELVTWLAKRDDVRILRRQGTNFAYLGFNMRDPVVGMPDVRKAIAHAIDRQAIIDYVMAGSARPASALLPPRHWAGAPDLALIAYDPARARALLREAGFSKARPARIVYKTSTDALRVRLATIIADQLTRAGMVVELRTYDWGTFYGDIKAGRFQMYSLAWVGIKMPDIFRYALHSGSVPPAGANRGRFRSQLADELIERAEVAQDMDEQAGLYRRLQRHLARALPYVPLWYEDHYAVMRDDIEGYTLAADGNYDGLVNIRRGGAR